MTMGVIALPEMLRRKYDKNIALGSILAGGTLGIVVRDAKPHILVRLPSTKAVGMNLDPKLLNLAEIVE